MRRVLGSKVTGSYEKKEKEDIREKKRVEPTNPNCWGILAVGCEKRNGNTVF